MLSTIIVTKNDRARIAKTLDSLSTQVGTSVGDWEIVIVDGGDDQLQDILSNFPSLPIRYFPSQDKGIYDAMNIGTNLSRGEFVHFLNCGDLLFEEFTLSKTLQAIDMQEFDLYFWDYSILGSLEIISFENVTAFNTIFYRNSYCHQAQIIRRRLLLDLKYNLNFKFCADYLTTLKILSIGKCKTLSFTGVYYEPGGFSDNHFSEIVLEKRLAFLDFISFSKHLGLELNKLDLIKGFLWNANPLLTKVLHRMFR